MGVQGLNHLIQCNRRSLAVEVCRSQDDAAHPIPFVVDGLSFVYHTGLSDQDSFVKYARKVEAHIRYWRAVGLTPIFVFDGPSDVRKLPKRLERARVMFEKDVDYYRASDDKRAQPNVKQSIARVSLLALSACVEELKILQVEVHFAEGEADSPTAELAQRLDGFIASADTDYFIFPANCRGYAPLSEMRYGAGSKQPPDTISAATLRLSTYHHTALAHLLAIPPSFLPIFASILGTDSVNYAYKLRQYPYSTEHADSGVTPAFAFGIAKKLAKFSDEPTNTIHDRKVLLEKVLKRLLRHPVRPNLMNVMISGLLHAAEAYQLVPLDYHSPDFPLHPISSDLSSQARSRDLYSAAHRQGRLGGVILQFLATRNFAMKGILEDPNIAATSSILGRPLRRWIYTIVNHELDLDRLAVREYLRVGEGITEVEVSVPTMEALLDETTSTDLRPLPPSVVQASVSYRQKMLLTACSASFLPRSPESDPFLPLLLSLRHIQRASERFWTTHEIRAALLVAILPSSSLMNPLHTEDWRYHNRFAPSKCAIQRSAELLQTLFHVEVLAEALLLAEVIPRSHKMFEGRQFRTFLRIGETALLGLLNRAGEMGEQVEKLVDIVERRS